MSLLIRADFQDKASPQIKKLDKNLLGLNKGIKTTSNSFLGLDKSLVGAVAGFVALDKVVEGGRLFIRTADNITLLNSRLALATKSSLEFATAQREIFEISQDTRTALESNIDLYTRISRSTKDFNTSQKDLLQITKTISEALIISGGDAQSTQAAIIQLGQAFSADFQAVGQELGSIREQAPRVYEALLTGTRTTSAEFKKLAEDGKLSTEIILKALLSQGETVRSEFSKIELTVGQAQTKVQNSAVKVVEELNKELQITKTLADQLDIFSKSLTTNQAEIVDTVRVTFAVISKTVDGTNLLYETLRSTGISIVQAINLTVFGAIKPITQLISQTAQGLEKLGLAPKFAVDSAINLESLIQEQVTNSANAISDSQERVREAYSKASASVEDRILLLKAEANLSKTTVALQNKIASTTQSTTTRPTVSSIPSISGKKQAFGDLATLLDTQFAEAEQFQTELANLGKTTTELELQELQTRFEANKQFIDKSSVEYENYSNRVFELQKKISDENAQLNMENLKNTNTFTAGAKVGMIELQQQSQDTFSLGKRAVSSFANSSADAIANFALTGKDDFKRLANSIISDLIRIAIRQQLTGLFASAIGGLSFGSSPKIGAFSGTTPNLAGATIASANGNAFNNGSLQKFANGGAFTNSIVDKPTYFPMAGNKTGLMGEAGEEAIMPLERIGGKLGVNASNMGSKVNVFVNVQNNAGELTEASVIEEFQTNQDGEEERIINIVVNRLETDSGFRSVVQGG